MFHRKGTGSPVGTLARFALVVVLALAACRKDPPPSYAGQPLPPSSGTPIGYLIDNSGQLELSAEQVTKLQAIDDSLSARNEGIDTQLREIEKPEPLEEDPKNPSIVPPNMAPGAQPVRTTKDAGKLHDARKENSKEALEKAFALLDAKQQEKARALLAERGITAPKAAKISAPVENEPPAPDSDTPVPQEP
ncbi:MAG: hypothetical protein AB7T06_27485 [Kofleriaceae bacterium]